MEQQTSVEAEQHVERFSEPNFVEPEAQKRERKTFDQLIEIYNNFAAFDWDLKDVKNLKHSPERELTPLVYWFWINS